MSRPRKALWESHDRSVYVKQHADGFLVVTTGEARRESYRVRLDDAMELARSIAAAPSAGADMTFFELALDYYAHGLPVWDRTTDQVAMSPDTLEDRKARTRNHYADVGNLPLSELPRHFIGDAVNKIRSRQGGKSKSLQDKVRLEGLAIVRWGVANGLLPPGHDYVGPLRLVKKQKINDTQLVGRHRRPLPSHRTVHQMARAAAVHTGKGYMRLFFWLLAYLGPREGDLCALEVGEVTVDTRVRVHFTKKVVWRTGKGTIVEHYTKGYEHRSVVVPRILERPLLARVEEVRAAGGTVLFARWSRRLPYSPYIDYSALKEVFVRCGAEVGWAVVSWSTPARHTGADGRIRTYKPRAQSLEFTIHDLRAFAASAMYEARRGISLRGMGMSLQATARQLGDNPETVKRHYLGIIEGNSVILDREVP